MLGLILELIWLKIWEFSTKTSEYKGILSKLGWLNSGKQAKKSNGEIREK